MMDKMDALVLELEQLSHTLGTLPSQVREVARTRLNGTLVGHPLIVHSGHKGPAMRVETAKETLWVSVPVQWFKFEP